MRRIIAATVLAATAALGGFTAIHATSGGGNLLAITGCCRG
jgi:hypothetical protein